MIFCNSSKIGEWKKKRLFFDQNLILNAYNRNGHVNGIHAVSCAKLDGRLTLSCIEKCMDH